VGISIDQYLKRLSNDLKLNEFYIQVAPKHCKLLINDFQELEIFQLEEGYSMSYPLGPIYDETDRDKLFAYLSQANFLGQGTGKSVIGLKPDEKTVTLTMNVFYDVDYFFFKERMEEMLNYIDFWKEHLKEKQASFVKQVL
jgi:hypothetical protein